MPEIEKLRKTYEDKGVGFLALTNTTDMAAVTLWSQKMGIIMPVAIAEDEVLAPYGLKVFPSTLFVDKDGMVVDTQNGLGPMFIFEKRIKALIP